MLIQLNIPVDEMARFYSGQATVVRTRSVTGQSIQFPAQHLRPFVTPSGVHGMFELNFTADHRFISLQRV